MMMYLNLFNIFDPMINNFPINYILNLYFLMLINKMNMNNQYINKMLNLIKHLIKKMNFMNLKYLMLMLMMLMYNLLLMNLMNLIPMIINLSTNLIYLNNLTLIFWMMNMIILMKKNKILFMIFSPKNCPKMILFIINLIELNSFFFQIISLSMRMLVNMMLGHMILKLINLYMYMYMYMLIELFIIFIQSYIFFMLNMLNMNNNF